MKIIQINEIVGNQQSPNLKWSVWNDVIAVNETRYVIFNTFTCSAVILQEDITKKIIEQLPQDVVQTLYVAGIIVNEDKDERSLFLESFCTGKKDLSYLDLTILLTHNCQFNCQYCFEGDKKIINIGHNVSQHIVEYLNTLVNTCKKIRVTWFGGEPLIAYQTLKKMSYQLLDFCKTNDIEYVADMTTNGYALTKERCFELVNEFNIKRFIITVDGLADIHDKRRPLRSGKSTFNTIWNNIIDLVNEGAWVTLRMTIDKENYPHIYKFLDYLAQSPLARRVGLSFCRTIDYNFTPKEIKTMLYSEVEFRDIEWHCILYANKLGLWEYSFPHRAPLGGCLRDGDIVISADGNIYKCLDTIGDVQWKTNTIEDMARGNVSSPNEWYRRWKNWVPTECEGCANCVLMPLCNGGCPHNALFRDKQHGTESQCPDWKANYQRQIIEIAKKYE